MKITDPNIQFVIKKTGCDGIGNVLKGFITIFSVNPNSKIECNPQYKLGVYDTVLAPQHIFHPTTTDEVNYMYTSRFLVLKDEEDFQPHINVYENREGTIGHISGCPKYNYLFSDKHLIDKNYNPDRVSNIVKKRIFKTIYNIEFLPIIYQKTNDILMNFNGKTVLGVSIRTWKCFHEKNIRRIYNPDTHIQKIKEVLELHPEINQIVMSYDNHYYEHEYNAFLKSLNIPVFVLRKNDDVNELQFSFIKMMVLSKSKCYIGNRNSTFSELVWWFSECTTKCYTVF